MNDHGTSVPSRQRRGTHIPRRKVRHAALAVSNARDSVRAFETYRAMTGASLDRLAGLPGIPSRSRLSHLRSDEENPVHQLDALIRAKIAAGDPIAECGLLPLHFWETIELSLATNAVPLHMAIVSDQHHDSAQDIAAFETIAGGMKTAQMESLVAALRVEVASKRTLMTCLLLEVERRKEPGRADAS